MSKDWDGSPTSKMYNTDDVRKKPEHKARTRTAFRGTKSSAEE